MLHLSKIFGIRADFRSLQDVWYSATFSLQSASTCHPKTLPFWELLMTVPFQTAGFSCEAYGIHLI